MKLSDKILWDVPIQQRKKLEEALENDPIRVFEHNEELFVKALNSLSWYELVNLFGVEKLDELLTEETIGKVFPKKRREYYKNARRLLSEYALSSSG